MTKKISQRDWEAISAYLDNQLKPRDRSKLEARLHSDPDLSAAVEELGQTRRMVQTLPEIRAPRNFTLTPEMVGHKPFTLQLFPTFRFASVLATILLVLVMAGDFFGTFNRIPYLADQAPAAQVLAPEAAEALVEEEVKVEVTLEVEMPAAEAPVEESAEPNALRVQEDEILEAEGESQVMPAEQPGMEGAAPEALTPSLGFAEPEEESLEEAPPAAAEKALADETETQDAYPAPETEPTQPVGQREEPGVTPSVFAFPADRKITTVQFIEIGLGLIALISGVVAFILRRSAG